MKKLRQLFMSKSELYLEQKIQYNFRCQPNELIQELNPANPDNSIFLFKEKLLSQSRDPSNKGMGLMRSLSVLHLIVMNTDQLYDFSQSLLPLCERQIQQNAGRTKNQIISSSILDTSVREFFKDKALYKYEQFLMKCLSSQQIYSKVKLLKQRCQIQYCSFDLFFFVRNLFNLLIASTGSISSMARFFMDSHYETVRMFGDICALQLISFYNAMVCIIVGIVRNDQTCLKQPKDRDVVRTIVLQQMSQVYGDINRFLQNKYFNFKKRGLRVKNFRIQDQEYTVMKKLTQITDSHKVQIKQEKQDIDMISPVLWRKNHSNDYLRAILSGAKLDSNKLSSSNAGLVLKKLLSDSCLVSHKHRPTHPHRNSSSFIYSSVCKSRPLKDHPEQLSQAAESNQTTQS